ncbi:hypothetical protein JHK82_046930 [Glycine max]|nr:hypothetical protein JHK85_047386 [Glycine max]KAG5097076.1 hypothetical protein JHK82_046930 [Glycine max]KAG5101862.1 hypothetical protein JHK84_046831 [Glycine max]KHN18396.1 hypothetical protein glysoja_006809 [Glycine soja]
MNIEDMLAFHSTRVRVDRKHLAFFKLKMSHSNDQNQPQAYESKDIAPGPNYQVPPPAIITHEEKVPPNGETKFKGDGFWRGCCAGMCCYCCLDVCF